MFCRLKKKGILLMICSGEEQRWHYLAVKIYQRLNIMVNFIV